MSVAADMQEAAAKAHWEVLGGPTCVHRTRVVPCLPGGSSDGQLLGIGPPSEEMALSLTFWKSAFLPVSTADDREDTSDPGSDPTADNAMRFPRKGDTIRYNETDYDVDRLQPADLKSALALFRVWLVSPNAA